MGSMLKFALPAAAIAAPFMMGLFPGAALGLGGSGLLGGGAGALSGAGLGGIGAATGLGGAGAAGLAGLSPGALSLAGGTSLPGAVSGLGGISAIANPIAAAGAGGLAGLSPGVLNMANMGGGSFLDKLMNLDMGNIDPSMLQGMGGEGEEGQPPPMMVGGAPPLGGNQGGGPAPSLADAVARPPPQGALGSVPGLGMPNMAGAITPEMLELLAAQQGGTPMLMGMNSVSQPGP